MRRDAKQLDSGAITLDAPQDWSNVGPNIRPSLPEAAGTSDLIIDKMVGSHLLPGPSQVRFPTLGADGPRTLNGRTGGITVGLDCNPSRRIMIMSFIIMYLQRYTGDRLTIAHSYSYN